MSNDIPICKDLIMDVPSHTAAAVADSACNSDPIVVREVTCPEYGEYVGCVKWFSNNIGYGFVTVYTDGEMKGRDVFVHHSGVKPLNSNYKTLQKGEYISFDLGASDNGKQAINVTGVYGGPLMCDHRPNFQKVTVCAPASSCFSNMNGGGRNGGSDHTS